MAATRSKATNTASLDYRKDEGPVGRKLIERGLCDLAPRSPSNTPRSVGDAGESGITCGGFRRLSHARRGFLQVCY